MQGSEAKESAMQTCSYSAINEHMRQRTLPVIEDIMHQRTSPAIDDIIPPVVKKKFTRHMLPRIRDFNSSSLPLTSPDIATEFTLFPKLIPELRLMIWQLAAALPTLRRNLLYPYQKGCWIFEDLGLEPDPNGEDLYTRFDTTRLKPLRFALPLYSVNREARDVILKWLREHSLTATWNHKSDIYDAFRPFNPQCDTMFVPSTKLDKFLLELLELPQERGMHGHYFGTSNPALPRLAVTPIGLQMLKGEFLEDFFRAGGTIGTILVVDNASAGSLQALESAGVDIPVELADQPVARVKWSYLPGLGEVEGDDERTRARLKEYVEGFDIQGPHPSGFELEIQLVTLA
jgi:hypothetical protein